MANEGDDYGTSGSPELADGPWRIVQSGKTAGYVWSYTTKVEYPSGSGTWVTVGTVEWWYLVTAINGNTAYKAFDSGAALSLEPDVSASTGAPHLPTDPPAPQSGNKPTYQKMLVQGSRVGNTFI